MRRRLVWVVALLAAGAGCSASTAPCLTPLDLGGTWIYMAEAVSPVRQRLTGAMRLDRGPSCRVAGVADVTVTDLGTGIVSPAVQGTVTGRVADGATIDVDLQLGLSARRHLGTVTPDSIFGQWFATSDGVNGPQGTFVLRRSAQ